MIYGSRLANLAIPILIIVGLTIVGLSMVGLVCFGSWLDGSGGCPAKMPWEMGPAILKGDGK